MSVVKKELQHRKCHHGNLKGETQNNMYMYIIIHTAFKSILFMETVHEQLKLHSFHYLNKSNTSRSVSKWFVYL